MDDAAESAAEPQETPKVDTLQRQKDYIKKLEDKNFDFSLIVADAFVDSMKSIGYKHTGTALAEDIDNALEANAQNVIVEFGYDTTEKKPARIAVIDDGDGMIPEMVRAAVLWGGGTRRDRKSFGRFGFGLPSSSVSIGNRFEVYSKVAGGEWHMVAIDLEKIAAGTFNMKEGRPIAPEAEEEAPPSWVVKAMRERLGKEVSQGTVIVIDKINRNDGTNTLTWKTTDKLETELLQFFGVTYRNFLHQVNLYVNGKKTKPVDPLFLDPNGQFYGENDLRAVAVDPIDIELKNKETGEIEAVIKVRFSYMPPGFQVGPDGKNNSRFNVMKANNGILMLRAGRQIDVVDSKCPWITFVNYDRNWKVEIDFPPSLDEEFSVTTNKQQIVLSERMWNILETHGVRRAITYLRGRLDKEIESAKEQKERPKQGEKRTSEDVMAKAEKYKTRKPEPSPEQQEQAQENFDKEAEERERETKKPHAEVVRELLDEIKAQPFKLGFEEIPEGPFYRAERVGSRVQVIINKSHSFYTEVYMAPDSTPRLRAALEVLLFVMGATELDARDERALFYKGERREWSDRLDVALQLLEKADPRMDINSARMEREESRQEQIK